MTILTTRYFLLAIAFMFSFSSFAQEKISQKKCIDCHTKTNAKAFIHEPSGESCKNCHEATGKPHPSDEEEGFKLTEKVPQLCYSCHDPVNTKKTLHPPVKRGDCLACHEVHSSKEKKLVFASPPDVCFFCHSDMESKLDTARSIHHITKNASSCISCHSPHQSAQPKLLITAERDLCLQCHDKSIQKEQRIISNIKNELAKNKYLHGAIIKNGCSGCHDPHAAAQTSLLKAAFTSETYVSNRSKENIALCFQCHDTRLMEKDKITDGTGFRDGDKNLHFKHINKRKGRNCVNCHGIHSAPNEFLLIDKVKFGEWDMPLVFTKTTTGGSCITACHAVKTYSRVVPK